MANLGDILIRAMKDEYTTLTGETLSLSRLNAEEKRFLGKLYAKYKAGISYLVFDGFYWEPDSPVPGHAKRLGKPAEKTPLYQVCDDLAKRLGIRQGYLVESEVVPGRQSEERKELTTGEVARLASCSEEAVRKAIRTARLRARRVGKFSLIWDKDAEAFALFRKGARGIASVPRR